MKRKQRQRQVVDQESTTSKVLALHFRFGVLRSFQRWLHCILSCTKRMPTSLVYYSGGAILRLVDVQLLCPSVIDNVDDIEEIVELFGDDAEEKTTISASVEENDDEFDEIATLPSSSKGKVSSTELCILKRDFQRTKDELAKVANSNRAL
ncbi:unnamed protein product [Prunus armeniaca]